VFTATDPVERVALTHLRIPMKEFWPEATAMEPQEKDAILVTLETSSGIAHGECSLMLAEGSAALEACWKELTETIAPSLLGRAISRSEDIGALVGSWSVGRLAAAGAETALWDLLGQAHHATVAQLLGADEEQIAMGVPSGMALGLYPSIVELLESIESHLVEGYRRIKIRIAPGRDIELVQAVRSHFEDVPLMVDGGGKYTTADIELFRELDDFDLLMFEQPMAADDLDGLAALQRAVSTPVCLDETATTLEQTAEAIRRGACRIVNLKIQRVGGLGPARAIHDHCFQNDVACWGGSTPEFGLGQAFGVHLAALANCKYPSDLEPSVRWFVDDYVSPAFEHSTPGLFNVPTRPGVGFRVDLQKVHRHQVRQQEFARTQSA